MFHSIIREMFLFLWLGNFLGLHHELLAQVTMSNYLPIFLQYTAELRRKQHGFEDLKKVYHTAL